MDRYKNTSWKHYNNLFFIFWKVRPWTLFDISVIFHEWLNMKLKLLTKILSLCGCGFWGKMHAIKIDYAAWRRLMWLLIGMISLTKIPETHSSLNDINIGALPLAEKWRTRSIMCDSKLSKMYNLELIYWIKSVPNVVCCITWMHIVGFWHLNIIFIFPSKIFTKSVIKLFANHKDF